MLILALYFPYPAESFPIGWKIPKAVSKNKQHIAFKNALQHATDENQSGITDQQWDNYFNLIHTTQSSLPPTRYTNCVHSHYTFNDDQRSSVPVYGSEMRPLRVMYCRHLEEDKQLVEPGFYRIRVVSQDSDYAKQLPHFDEWAKSISQIAINSRKCNVWGHNHKLISIAGQVTNCFSVGERYQPISFRTPFTTMPPTDSRRSEQSDNLYTEVCSVGWTSDVKRQKFKILSNWGSYTSKNRVLPNVDCAEEQLQFYRRTFTIPRPFV